jgi:hypothetical protein
MSSTFCIQCNDLRVTSSLFIIVEQSGYSAEIIYLNSGVACSFGGGGGGCFISSAADGQRSGALSLVFIGAILAGIFGFLIYHRPLPFGFAQEAGRPKAYWLARA